MASQEQATTEQQISQSTAAASTNEDQSISSQTHCVTQSTQESISSVTEKPAEPTNPRLAAITAKKATLEATLASLQSRRSALVAEAKLPSGLDMPADWTEEQRTKQALASANEVIKEHIAHLHRYNEIKDIGQGLVGLIADKRGVRVSEVMTDYDMSEKD